MKKILLWTIALCLLLLLLGAGLFAFKNPILKKVTVARIQSETGLNATIGDLNLSFGSGAVTVKNFRIMNAPEFGSTPLLDIPEVHLALDSNEAAAGKLRFTEIRFHLAELNIVKSKTGELNLESLEKRQRSRPPAREKRSARELQFAGIDRLYLSLGAIRFTDLQNPELSTCHVLGLTDHLIQDIKTEDELKAHLLALLLQSAIQEWMNPTQKAKSRGLGGLLKALGR